MKRVILFFTLLCLLCGCAQEPFATYTLDGGAVCRVYGNTMGIRRIEVTAADGTEQRFSLKNPDIEPDDAGGIKLADLNFDGHPDLLAANRQYASGDIRYVCYLWQDGGLAESPELSQLCGLTVDAEAGRLIAWESRLVVEEYESRARLTYAWHEGMLVPVGKLELIHYIAEDEEIYCRIESAAEPGQPLAVLDEKWIFPDQFDETTFWN